jgi:hypothetical protein
MKRSCISRSRHENVVYEDLEERDFTIIWWRT